MDKYKCESNYLYPYPVIAYKSRDKIAVLL